MSREERELTRTQIDHDVDLIGSWSWRPHFSLQAAPWSHRAASFILKGRTGSQMMLNMWCVQGPPNEWDV